MLQKLTATWDVFEEIQAKIEASESEEETRAIHEEERRLFETKYFEITTAFETLLEEKILK